MPHFHGNAVGVHVHSDGSYSVGNPAPSGAVSACFVSGQTLTISGSCANAMSGTVSVAASGNGAVAIGPLPLVISGNAFSFSLGGVTPGSYAAPVITLTGPGGSVGLTGLAFVILGIGGTALAPDASVAPSITSQPANATVSSGGAATFVVVASGSAPLSYQWRRNGAPITGATGSSYTTPALNSADNGAAFSVVVSNGRGSVTSASATVTVLSSGGGTDTQPPALTGAVAITEVTATSAVAQWPPGTDNVAVSSYQISLNAGPYADVGLTLLRVLTGLTPNTSYSVAVRALDAAGNASAPPIYGAFITPAQTEQDPIPGVRQPDLVVQPGAERIALRRTRQPREAREYLIDLSRFFAGRLDQPLRVDVPSPVAGYTLTARIDGYTVRINESGGLNGKTYNTPVLLRTTSRPADVREIDVTIKVRDIK